MPAVLEGLSPELMAHLDGEKLVLLSTIEKETASPNVTAISWVKTKDDKHIRFAVTRDSRIIHNIKNNPQVVLCVIALESVYSIAGTCSILTEEMNGVPLKLVKFEVHVDKVFESMFWGAKIIQEPLFEKTYNPKKAKELDEKVYQALMS
ncbi:putative pyridoxamine 5'-phosphate oxidase family protein [Caldalkalibacillus uzonensis]|uniref:Pyridoxamine 5'-phosphate oxidase family protein n=1 Tax=Caldalkalibacillus uzonensis TaxID=353224 RepID=A0ABU0CQV5_9BACI|nr:pyridoxamine 5'-phosphate oxidase family protein [Caldalkalibacillus uzonensis]MDQ0338798.1 putative pyridoxamine 5'-phosphate oxidase family protein [Caldalkalibacillus uzonensis]